MLPALPDPNDGSAPIPPAEPPPASDAQRVAAIRAWHDDLRQLSPRAPVTPILVGVNVLVFVVMVASGVNPLDPKPDVLLKWGADFGPVTFGGEWWRLLTAAFLHGGAVHLAMNMFCLLGVGKATERMIGSPGFLL
ncbi:MAG TPA: rhomboid family intramembrane serine protease, partial [Gemmataceae bacterium]|nr:rhomboid family intramembrane serine protease [Gemmataceae bacterium]